MAHQTHVTLPALVAGLLVLWLLPASAAGSTAPSQPASALSAASMSALPLSPCTPTDNGDPRLTGIHFDPPEVDVTDHAQPVRIIATGADTGGPGPATGIRYLSVSFPFSHLNASESGELTAAGDGTWVGRVVIPRGSETGIRTVDNIQMYDNAGNIVFIAGDAVHAHGLDASLAVRSATPLDRRPPVITSFTASRTRVDTRGRAKNVRFTMHATDATSGVKATFVHLGYWRADLRLVSGTPVDGMWAGHLRLPRWFTAADTDLDLTLEAFDALGNYQGLDEAALRRRHLPHTLHLRARPDTTKPVLRVVRQSTTTADARSHDARVVLTLRGIDRGAGVETVGLGYGDDTFTYFAHRIAGTRHSGTWRVAVPVPHCFQRPGTHQYATSIGAWDALGNILIADQRLRWTTLTSDTAPPRHADFTPLDVPASVVGTAGAVLRFGEDVVGLTSTSAPVRPFDPDAMPGSDPPPPVAGTWACETAAGTSVDCVTGPVRTARWSPTAPLAPGRYMADLNPEHVLELTDVHGNAPTNLQPVFNATN